MTAVLTPTVIKFDFSQPAQSLKTAISVSVMLTIGEVYSMKIYVVHIAHLLWQVCDFFQVSWFIPPIKLTAMIFLIYFIMIINVIITVAYYSCYSPGDTSRTEL